MDKSRPSFYIGVVGSLLGWWVCSLLITFCNKIVFDTMGFNFPLSITMYHFASSAMIMFTYFSFCGRSAFPKVELYWYIRYIIPVGMITGVEVAMSNMTYKMVSISAMTVIKSSSPTVVFLLAVVFGMEKFRFRLFAISLFILGSISLTIAEMEIYNPIGVVILYSAVLIGGIRWILVQKLYQIKTQALTPQQLMLLFQPIASIVLFFPSSHSEMPRFAELVTSSSFNVDRSIIVTGVVLLCAIFVAALWFFEYKFVQLTSPMSLCIGSIGKEVLMILMSVKFFNENLSLIARLGVFLSILGIGLYIREKFIIDRENEERSTIELESLKVHSVNTTMEDSDDMKDSYEMMHSKKTAANSSVILLVTED